MSHDAVIVGSGFGGAFTALALTEAGLSVLLLERGNRWLGTTAIGIPDRSFWEIATAALLPSTYASTGLAFTAT